MALRAKKPQAVVKRLKMFMFGTAGVGKTTAAIQFPNSYIIDAERGSENYDKIITASHSAVFQTNDMADVVAEVKSLLTEHHDYKTLVIDPITTLYNDLLEKCELKVGSDFGRHYGEANKTMKRLANLIMALDMNVIVTAHAKAEYGQNLAKLGYTFDGWKQLDYWFDLVMELSKKNKQRFAKVVKTRIETFPDQDVFEWSYEAIRKRYDIAVLEKPAAQLELASSDQVREIKELLNVVRLDDGTTDKWFSKAGVDVWEDMPADVIAKCIQYVRNRLPGAKIDPPATDPKPSPRTPTKKTPAPTSPAPATIDPAAVAQKMVADHQQDKADMRPVGSEQDAPGSTADGIDPDTLEALNGAWEDSFFVLKEVGKLSLSWTVHQLNSAIFQTLGKEPSSSTPADRVKLYLAIRDGKVDPRKGYTNQVDQALAAGTAA